MKERTIKVTCDEGDPFKHRHVFLITVNDNGAEIRLAGAPVVSRDTSVTAFFGYEPHVASVVIKVEEVP